MLSFFGTKRWKEIGRLAGQRGAELTPEQRFALLFDWCRQTLVWAADRS